MIPKKININGIEYKIILSHDELRGKREWGSINYETQEIIVDIDLEEDRLLHAFFHECVHGFDTDNIIKDSGKELSENEIDRIASLILILMKQIREDK